LIQPLIPIKGMFENPSHDNKTPTSPSFHRGNQLMDASTTLAKSCSQCAFPFSMHKHDLAGDRRVYFRGERGARLATHREPVYNRRFLHRSFCIFGQMCHRHRPKQQRPNFPCYGDKQGRRQSPLGPLAHPHFKKG